MTTLDEKVQKLSNKTYRDLYVRNHVDQGIAFQVRAMREDRGWTQAELAKRMGLQSQSAVARLEDPSNGALTLSTLAKLAKVFDVAMLAKLVPYSQFLEEMEDLTPKKLAAASFEQERPSLGSPSLRRSTFVKNREPIGDNQYSQIAFHSSASEQNYRRSPVAPRPSHRTHNIAVYVSKQA